jgi:hypothetical protein
VPRTIWQPKLKGETVFIENFKMQKRCHFIFVQPTATVSGEGGRTRFFACVEKKKKVSEEQRGQIGRIFAYGQIVYFE